MAFFLGLAADGTKTDYIPGALLASANDFPSWSDISNLYF